MIRIPSRVTSIAIRIVLIVGLVALLFWYALSVTDLPSRVYTTAQLEVLRDSSSLRIAQSAPTWNLIGGDYAEGIAAPIMLPLRQSRVRAYLDARYEERGGVTVTVYDLEFLGEYLLRHEEDSALVAELVFPFPANLDTLHDVVFLVDGEEPSAVVYSTDSITWRTMLLAGEEHDVSIGYRADGASSFAYTLPHNQRSDVDVSIVVSGLDGSTISRSSLPTTTHDLADGTETFTWDYQNLIANRDIHLSLPSRLTFAQRVARQQEDFRLLANLAPLLIGGALIALAGLIHMSELRLRLESYLLVGFALALFFPLLTYLSGTMAVALAALLAMLLVSGLVLAFLWMATRSRRLLWQAGLLLLVFLGGFALGTLTPWRGLLWTISGLVLAAGTLLLWSRRAVRPASESEHKEPAPESTAFEEILTLADAPDQSSGVTEEADEPDAQRASELLPDTERLPLHCPQCGRSLSEDHSYCPGCGHSTASIRRCPSCDYSQMVAEDPGSGQSTIYCLRCGEVIATPTQAPQHT